MKLIQNSSPRSRKFHQILLADVLVPVVVVTLLLIFASGCSSIPDSSNDALETGSNRTDFTPGYMKK